MFKNSFKVYGILGVLVLLLAFSGKIVENVPADEVVVIQNPLGGLKVITTAGPAGQWGGSATHYKKSWLMSFSKDVIDGDTVDQSIKVRFNDGGHANLSGSVRVDLPTSEQEILALHIKFGSQTAIENSLIKQVITKSVYMTGPMMSSKEASAEKRNDLLSFIEDQAIGGVYKTIVVNTRVKDPMDTTIERTVGVVQIKKDEKGNALRQEASAITQFGLRLYNLSINSIDYDNMVERQIQTQQQAVMSVQTAIANAKKAEQDAYTTAKQGEAKAAEAKWTQEAIKAAAVTEAEKIRDVAKLTADAEEQNKRANILKGQGEAEYKRLVTQANNNLEARLEAWVEVNKAYATAMSQSNWVPTYVSGGGYGSTSGYSGGAADLINMMMVKTAKDLGIESGTGNKK